jgi:hypothetical protein
VRRSLPLLALLALLASGCGGGAAASSSVQAASTATPTASVAIARSPYARRLAALCVGNRVRLEHVGKPSVTPLLRALPRQVAIWRAFIGQLRALRPAASERARARVMVRDFDYWVAGQQYGLVQVRKHNDEGYFAVEEDALRYLTAAENAAARLSARECSRRPFEAP